LFALLDRHNNLFCDLSNLCTYLAVEEILERFDSGRMLFGTGLPMADPGGPIARLFYTDAPQGDLAAMAHGNIERLLARSGAENEEGQ
jgi:predicted TIM-barrel fold metal-dependent hydrolase